jgi:hypothetical protein
VSGLAVSRSGKATHVFTFTRASEGKIMAAEASVGACPSSRLERATHVFAFTLASEGKIMAAEAVAS